MRNLGPLLSSRLGLPISFYAMALAALFSVASLHAHTPDTSYCKIAIGADEVTFTFTFDLLTLTRMAPLDANHDKVITHAELIAATPAIEDFLRRSVYVEINEREGAFGPLVPPVWADDANRGIPIADW